MARSRELGMQTFDQSLYDLYEGGLITYEDALRNADSLNDLRLRIIPILVRNAPIHHNHITGKKPQNPRHSREKRESRK